MSKKIFHVILAIVSITLLFSCLTSKRADRRLEGIEAKYPAKIATFARDKYPCVILGADTVINVVQLPPITDTLEVDSAIVINCPDSGAKVKVSVKYYYITKTVTKDTTFRIFRTVEDSAKVKLMAITVAYRDATIVSQAKKITRRNTLLWVLLGLFALAVLGNYLQAKKIL